jgi:hypothetical protein
MQISGILIPFRSTAICNKDKKFTRFSIILLDPIFSKLNAVYENSCWQTLLSIDLTESKSIKVNGYMAVQVRENEWREKGTSLIFVATQVVFDSFQDAR